MTPGANQQAVMDFRANRGELGGVFADARVVVLTTTDSASGMQGARPVVFHHDEQGRSVILAVPCEDGTLPYWYENVLADPRVSVETGTALIEAEALVLTGRERDAVYARVAEVTPELDEKQMLLGAPIPIVALRPRSRTRLGAASWGTELKAVHDGFRRELALIRKELASAGPDLAAQLRINCLTACAMLRRHHVSEDDEVFPLVDRRHPELAAATARMREEHLRLQDLLDGLKAVVSRPTAGSAPVLAEVERLTSEIEAHLDYEEEQLFSVLNSLDEK